MATVEIVDAKDAPPPPRPMTKTAQESLAILNQLSKGKVARVTPDEGQTIRGLKASLGRFAKNQGIKAETWDVDGVLYVRLV
jgi:hypothetical protein